MNRENSLSVLPDLANMEDCLPEERAPHELLSHLGHICPGSLYTDLWTEPPLENHLNQELEILGNSHFPLYLNRKKKPDEMKTTGEDRVIADRKGQFRGERTPRC